MDGWGIAGHFDGQPQRTQAVTIVSKSKDYSQDVMDLLRHIVP